MNNWKTETRGTFVKVGLTSVERKVIRTSII